MPLARREGLVAVRTQHLRQVRRLAGHESPRVGKAVDHLRHPPHADAVMVAPGEQAGPRRRAERGDVKVGVAQAIGGEAVEGGGLDVGAVAAEVRIAHIVQDDHDDVGTSAQGEGGESQAMVESAAVRLMVPVKSRSCSMVEGCRLRWYRGERLHNPG